MFGSASFLIAFVILIGISAAGATVKTIRRRHRSARSRGICGP